MENYQFMIKDKNNKEKICDVIATYHHDDTNKDFMVYTDKTFDENNNLKLYYSLYENSNNSIKLIPVIDIDDKKIGLQLIQEIIKDINS